MRFLLFTILVGLGSVAHSQNWCPPGARWTYAGAASQYSTNRIIRYTGDTVIAGENAQILFIVDQIANSNTQAVDTLGSGWNMWTRSNDTIIWIWSSSLLAWDTLYFFGAVPGSQWGPPFADPGFCGSPEDGDMVQVVDTGTTIVQGVPLRYWDINLGVYNGRITERMGWSVAFVLFEGCWQGVISEFKCYEDYEINYSVQSDPGYCELATGSDDLATAKPNLVPNPGTDHFTLSLPPGAHTITLFDATGRTAFQEQVFSSPAVIGTAQLPSGVYVVRVDDGVEPIRWVKE